MKWALLVAMLVAAPPSAASSATGLIERIFAAAPEAFHAVLSRAEERRVQVFITELGTRNNPRALVRHRFRVGAEYLYPASALKPAAAIAAIQSLQRLSGAKGPDVDLRQRIALEAVFKGDERRHTNLALAIRATLIVSSNTAYNRLYELTGQAGLNQAMWSAGLSDVRLSHRLSRILSVEDNRRTPAWTTRQHGRELKVPEQRGAQDLTNRTSKRLRVGRAYREHGALIPEPMDFARKNHMGIEALQDLLLMLVRPEVEHGMAGFELRAAHRAALIDALTTLPHLSTWPIWPRENFDPYRFKPFLRGLERVQPLSSLRVVSKAGKAYGFRVDNAYIEDRQTGQAFLLTAGLHVDMDGTLNDDRYDYDLADRFLADLAEGALRALRRPSTRQPSTR
jgi:hypothetical protein